MPVALASDCELLNCRVSGIPVSGPSLRAFVCDNFREYPSSTTAIIATHFGGLSNLRHRRTRNRCTVATIFSATFDGAIRLARHLKNRWSASLSCERISRLATVLDVSDRSNKQHVSGGPGVLRICLLRRATTIHWLASILPRRESARVLAKNGELGCSSRSAIQGVALRTGILHLGSCPSHSLFWLLRGARRIFNNGTELVSGVCSSLRSAADNWCTSDVSLLGLGNLLETIIALTLVTLEQVGA
mmetsp:Transcript_7428/g.15941  ORF Transcript_7428/g.15941 Transcript_7428/m.15941 type:complete len:246 (-) Transcript_7428:757-1494(-)